MRPGYGPLLPILHATRTGGGLALLYDDKLRLPSFFTRSRSLPPFKLPRLKASNICNRDLGHSGDTLSGQYPPCWTLVEGPPPHDFFQTCCQLGSA